jgi:hypothetical protein
MGIFRSSDPTTFDDVDGIVINESAPAPNVAGVAANIGLLLGQCQRGPAEVTEVGSIGEFHELYGKASFGVNLALKNKKFGRLKIARVMASAAAKASLTLQNGDIADAITFTAKFKGAYGNLITVAAALGSIEGIKYTIQDENVDAVLPIEVYDNVVIADITSATFAGSKLVDVTVIDASDEPATQAATALAAGSDGSVADADYQTAIGLCEVEGIGNFLCLDSYNATRNGYLKTHVANTQDKMAILAGAEADSVSTAITAAASMRDTEGRLIYAYPWIQTSLDGVPTYTSPAPWLLSILTQTAPNIDPAYAKNVQFMSGALGLKVALTRSNYINLKDAGVCAFEKDDDLGGLKPKSGVTTQIADSSKVMILRRRMADFLTASVAKFLKNYQNAVNSKQNRALVKGAMLGFIDSLERDGILPKDSEVKSGKAKLVDTESLNTDASIASGFFKILWRQRIFSSMRYIVLQAEIGESVVVTEQAS